MKKHLKIRAVVAAVVASCALAACSPSDDGGSDSGLSGSAGAERTITHAMGTAEVTDEIDTVVALDRGLLDAAIALDLNVVGYTEISGSNGIPNYFGEDGRSSTGEAVSVGTLSEPSLERISELAPDAILSAKVRHEDIYEPLSRIAPTIFVEETGETWKENLLFVGEAIGRLDEAERLIADYEDRAQRIGDRVREQRGGNPSVTVVRFLDEPTRIYREDTYIGVIMSDLGFERNEASSGTGFNTEISEEQIGLMDADHIFISTYGDEEKVSERTKEEFERNPLWGKLKGEITEVDDGTWMSAVGLYGANAVLDDVAETFGVSAK